MKPVIVKIVNDLGKTVPIVRYDQDVMVSGKKYPLVVFLHGRGEYTESENLVRVHPNLSSNDGLNHTNLLKAADKHGFLVIAPQFIQAYNYDYRDGKLTQSWLPDWAGGYYVDDCIEWALQNMPVDPSRIYLTGLSSGGSGTWQQVITAQQFTAKIAAIIPICGGQQAGDWMLPVYNNVAVWGFHALDDTGPPAVNTINSVNLLNDLGINPPAKKTIYQTGGHAIWGTVYNTPELYTWMLSQSKSTLSTTTTSTTTIMKIELGRTWIPKLGKFVYIYDDGSTELK